MTVGSFTEQKKLQRQAWNWEQRKLITCKTNHFKIKLKYILQTKNKNEVQYVIY